MTHDPLRITHRAGDPCPADLFIVTPVDRFRSAVFGRDVECVGSPGAPYTIRYSASLAPNGAAVLLDLDPGTADDRTDINGQGSAFINVDEVPSGAAIRLVGRYESSDLTFTIT